jgi:hypothetical protein
VQRNTSFCIGCKDSRTRSSFVYGPPEELTELSYINLRLPTAGGFHHWEISKGGLDLAVRMEGRLVSSTAAPAVKGALAGAGPACVLEHDRFKLNRSCSAPWL